PRGRRHRAPVGPARRPAGGGGRVSGARGPRLVALGSRRDRSRARGAASGPAPLSPGAGLPGAAGRGVSGRADPGNPAPRAGGAPGVRPSGGPVAARALDLPRAAAVPPVSPPAGRRLRRPAVVLEGWLSGELDGGGAGDRSARGVCPHAASTCRRRRTARPARVLTVPRG